MELSLPKAGLGPGPAGTGCGISATTQRGSHHLYPGGMSPLVPFSASFLEYFHSKT